MTASARHMTFKEGDLLNNTFRIEAVLGSGGTSEVYRARNEISGRSVALKVLKAEFAGNEDFLLLLKREEEMRDIRHDAVVGYSENHRTADGHIYLVMDFVNGPSLEARMKAGGMSAEELVIVCRRVAQGLHVAHERRIFHRDLSPDNIILKGGDPARAVIIDFGIAKDSNPGAKTVVGSEFAGKFAYAAPEQLGGMTDARTDIYALGVTLLATFRGRHPDMGDNLLQVLERKKQPVDLDGVPEPLNGLLQRMVHADPDSRFQSCREILAEIAQIAPGQEDIPELTQPPEPSPVLRVLEEPASSPVMASAIETKTSAPQEKRRSPVVPILLVLLLLGGGGGAAWFMGLFGGDETPIVQPTPETLPAPETETATLESPAPETETATPEPPIAEPTPAEPTIPETETAEPAPTEPSAPTTLSEDVADAPPAPEQPPEQAPVPEPEPEVSDAPQATEPVQEPAPAQDTVPFADPFVLTAEKGASGALSFSGSVPSEGMLRDLSAIGDARALAHARGTLAEGWEEIVRGAISEAGALERFTLRVDGNRITLEGRTGDAATRDRLEAFLKMTGLPAGLEMSGRITYLPPPLTADRLLPILAEHADCGPLNLTTPPLGGYALTDSIRVHGNLSDAGARVALYDALRAASEGRVVTVQTEILNQPLCKARQSLPQLPSGGIGIEFGFGASGKPNPGGTFFVGENPVIDIVLPDGLDTGYLYVSIIDVTGSVFHLLPKLNRQENAVATLRGEQSGLVSIRVAYPVADSAPDRIAFQVDDSLLGKSEVLVLHSDTPLFDALRPTAESVESYTEALANAQAEGTALADARDSRILTMAAP